MRCYYTAEAVRALDEKLVALGFGEEVLMENAGRGCADWIRKVASSNRCVVFAGPGNNGGDGLVIARHLRTAGWHVVVLIAADRSRYRGASAVNLALLEEVGIETLCSDSVSDVDIEFLLSNAAIVVDALLGTGSRGEPSGEIARMISLINRSKRPVFSVDIPSGMDPVSGQACDVCVKADWTCAVAARKLLHGVTPGVLWCGKVLDVDIGVDAGVFLPPCEVFEVEKEDAMRVMPRRDDSIHKGMRGGVLVVAGSRKYGGAALLAARGALRAGAGLVVLASVSSLMDAVASSLPEVIFEALDDGRDLPDVVDRWKDRCSVMLLGSGLDRDARARAICEAAVSCDWPGRKFWDGDGLFWLAELGIEDDGFVTPHEGEAGRLLGCSSASVGSDRIGAVSKLAQRYGGALLKGFRSLVSDGNRVYVVPVGNRVLAVPGSGDVLSGVVSALAASGLDGVEALMLGAWLHGYAGQVLSKSNGFDGCLASEVADAVSMAMMELGDRNGR